MPIYRLRVDLTGFAGAAGLNTWWFAGDGLTVDDANSIGVAVRNFYEAVKTRIVVGTTITPQASLDILDVATGQLAGTVNMSSAPGPTAASGTSAALSRATQLKLRFLTSVVSDGRYIQGGVFLGPASANPINSSGEVNSSDRSAITAALVTNLGGLLGNGTHAVYRQPRRNYKNLPDRDGSYGIVTGYEVKPLPAVLRSRRD
jgi:hypothetical protein